MNFLEQNQKQEIRAIISDDIILYEPTDIQLNELKNILKDNMEVDKDLNGTVEMSYKYIRWIIRELCKDGAFIDEYTDEQLEDFIDNGNRNIKRLMDEIINLISEISEDMLVEYGSLITTYSQLINAVNTNADMVALESKIDKLFKKNGYENIKFQDILEGKITPEMLEKDFEN